MREGWEGGQNIFENMFEFSLPSNKDSVFCRECKKIIIYFIKKDKFVNIQNEYKFYTINSFNKCRSKNDGCITFRLSKVVVSNF